MAIRNGFRKKVIREWQRKMKLCSGQCRCTLLFSFGHQREENEHFYEPISLNDAHSNVNFLIHAVEIAKRPALNERKEERNRETRLS